MKFLGKIFAILISLLIISSFSASVFAKKQHAARSAHKHTRTKTTKMTHARPIYGTQNLVAQINQIISSADSNASIGIQIKSMKYGDMFYTRNEQRIFVPASILKILTAEAALAFLGPEYKFTTKVLTNAQATSNGIIDGDLYLVHSGDPSLTYYDLTDLMVVLKEQQVQTINGNIYIDNTAYDQDNLGPGWLEKDTRYCYAAPINASIINHNCISLGITPAKTSGRTATIVESPRYFYAGIRNTVITKSAKTRSCRFSLNIMDDNSIALDGCMAAGHYSRGASVVIPNIIKYNESLLTHLFKRFNIRVAGDIKPKAAPTDLFPLAIHNSKPLHILINEMLKKSDNIIAGSLLKKMGELYSNQPGSWQNGGNAIKQILAQKAYVNTAQMNVIDGSGLSRDNQVTPSQMMQALDFAFHNYSTNYEFISSLPIAGVDGTLKNRLKNIAWKVRAKTGTMAGVASLAGYVVSKDREPIAFVIIVNGHNGNIWKYREIEDKIVTALANYTRNN
ncbi:MAG: D-alanyl-D-alanine carboxypeptidase/D-alanyl-D-alanine-endopeptidase [uncultured bacterium]|nr:MAG: D-alanyl-D-alanine carboxypeptidase/D-alanyl-D-alanine-endopeptidase [uncultured bacterium]